MRFLIEEKSKKRAYGLPFYVYLEFAGKVGTAIRRSALLARRKDLEEAKQFVAKNNEAGLEVEIRLGDQPRERGIVEDVKVRTVSEQLEHMYGTKYTYRFRVKHEFVVKFKDEETKRVYVHEHLQTLHFSPTRGRAVHPEVQVFDEDQRSDK